MTTRRILHIAAIATILVGSTTLLVRACGPDYEPDVFIESSGPADDFAFSKGHLGVLQGSYYIRPKSIAFRYLNGGTLDATEQAQLAKSNNNKIDWQHLTPEEYKKEMSAERAKEADTGTARWSAAASPSGAVKAVGQNREIVITNVGFNQAEDVLNCPDNAFDTAVATFKDRAMKWGKDSPAFHDWLTAQHQVFSNCVTPGQSPADPPANAPALLLEDRAYQKASALFYAGQYPASRDAFTAIARDTASPWSQWGDYLAARSLVRQAFLSAPATDPYSGPAKFDPTLLAQAAVILKDALKRASTLAMHHAIQAELDLINARLEPEAQLKRLAAFVAGPQHDPEFGQHLVDINFLLDQGKSADAPLLQWLKFTGTAFGSNQASRPLPPKGTQGLAEARWKQTGQTPWLIAALMQSTAPDPDLLAAAAAIPESSPAYLTAQFHRARLLLAAHQLAAARSLTSHVLTLTRRDKEPEATNAFLSLHTQTAETFDDFLTDAPRDMISGDSQAAALALQCAALPPSDRPCKKTPLPDLQFDADAAAVFNQRLPLSLWVEAAHNRDLPDHLRAQVAWAAWLRALILNQPEVARSLIPLLPEPIRNVLAKSPDPNGFAASLVLLHATGFRAFLTQGVQLSASFGSSTNLWHNWWCAGSTDALTAYGEQPAPPPEQPTFLTPLERRQATEQVRVLDANKNGVIWLGHRVIDYVQAHPDHPIAPESLALVVRATHYGRCTLGETDKQQTQISKQAFTLLHTRYPKSEWTAKTPYYY